MKSANIQAWPTPIEIIFPIQDRTLSTEKARLKDITKADETTKKTSSDASEKMSAPSQNEDHDFEVITKEGIPSPEKLKAYGKGMR